MNPKALVLLAAFLLLAPAVSGEELAGQKYSIELNSNGFAHVVEHYYYSFEHPFDFNQFLSTVEKNGSSLLGWQAYDSRIAPHFGSDQTVANAEITFDGKAKLLKLEYDLVDAPFATKVSEDSRSIVWQLTENAFLKFQKGSILVIPADTEITISIPSNATYDAAAILPTPTKSDAGSITWKGYLPTNKLNVTYQINKPIASTIDLQTLFNGVVDSPVNLAIAVALAALMVYAYFNRRKIAEKIEGYIVEHSEISEKEPEEVEVETD